MLVPETLGRLTRVTVARHDDAWGRRAPLLWPHLMSAAAALPGIDRAPARARRCLVAGAAPRQASHAYLFHGPAGAGKRAVARAFAAALLADGADDPAEAARSASRAARIPTSSGSRRAAPSEMLVADIDEPVVAAATRTPFEARRRVFVIESADTMGDATANRLLKTLEEPADFVHLILLTARPGEVLPTVASRCQHVRFEAPSAARLAARCSRRGSTRRRRRLRAARARRRRARAGAGARRRPGAARRRRGFAVDASHGERRGASRGRRCSRSPRRAGERAGADARGAHVEDLELVARTERARFEREHAERVKRAVRRRAAGTLDLGLALVECGTATPR